MDEECLRSIQESTTRSNLYVKYLELAATQTGLVYNPSGDERTERLRTRLIRNKGSKNCLITAAECFGCSILIVLKD